MGVLDDAIREHLDLKRRRGADPAEIERAEREALGPVRRDAPAAALTNSDVLPGAQSEPADFPHDDTEFAVEAAELADDIPSPLAAETELSTTGFGAPPHAEITPEQVRDHLDPPTGAPLAAMPPEPENRPKRRHLFGRRHHHDEVPELAPLESELPADDDPFAEPPAVEAGAGEPPSADPRSAAPPAGEPRLIAVEPESAPALPEPPKETAPGESVSRARPIGTQPTSAEPATHTEPATDPERPANPEPPASAPPPALRLNPEPEQTTEFAVEDTFFDEEPPASESAPAAPASGEDILEETPDFLADAPDHDRLWFEQKPPPDFDFDA